MTSIAATTRAPGAVALIEAGERLVARHGVDGVSLRQIANDAGSGNNSAVQYHFGSKDGLLRAVFEHRLPQLISERQLLASRTGLSVDLRALLEAQFLPLARIAEDTSNLYVRFVEQMQRYRPLGTFFRELPADLQQHNSDFACSVAAAISAQLPDLPEKLIRLRQVDVQTMMLHTAADRERAIEADSAPVPSGLYVSSALDCWVGYLCAEPSSSTIASLTD